MHKASHERHGTSDYGFFSSARHRAQGLERSADGVVGSSGCIRKVAAMRIVLLSAIDTGRGVKVLY